MLEPTLPPPEQFGRRRTIELRQIGNALFYVLRTGCGWRYLPQDYPCWQTVYYYFRRWQDAEWFADLNEKLRRSLALPTGTRRSYFDADKKITEQTADPF